MKVTRFFSAKVRLAKKKVKTWGYIEWLVVFIVCCAFFLRFYKIEETVMFLGDQGRDALVVSRMFTHADPVFIGPVMSVGNIYLGPLYYYIMLPFLWLSYPSPMGPVYAMAILGVISVIVAYWVGKQLWNKQVGLFAAFLLAFNPAAITLSRYSWNPNPAVLFGLLWFYSLVQAWKGKHKHWILVGLWISVLMQLHYVTLITLIVSGVVWLVKLGQLLKGHSAVVLVKPTLAAIGIFMLFLSPLVLFDIKHKFLNLQSFSKILYAEDAFGTERTLGERLWQITGETRGRSMLVLLESHFGQIPDYGLILTALIMLAGIYFLATDKDQQSKEAFTLLTSTVWITILILSVYNKDVYTHYLAFCIPLVSLFLAYVLDRLIRINKTQIIIVVLLLGSYAYFTVTNYSFVGTGPSLDTLQLTAASIHERLAENDPYALLLLSPTMDHYGMNYRYYLSVNKNKTPVDPGLFGQVRKLVVIQEDPSLVKPLETPLYELQVFNVATPSATWKVENGPTVFLLEK